MKILYFYQYFSTSKGSWGTRVYDFAKNWVQQGHEVTVVTAIYSKSDLISNKIWETQVHDGIKVIVINLRIDNKQPVVKRIWSFLLYSVISSWFSLKVSADLVIASSGPITVGIPGLVAYYLRRRKLVFEVRDLWPQGAIEMGVIKNRMVKWMAYWFEKRCYKVSSLIVALSPGMQSDIERRFDLTNVITVTNAANIKLFGTPVPSNGAQDYGNYAIYTGNIGQVNKSMWIYEAAKILKEWGREDIKILLVGDGQLKEQITKLKQAEKLKSLIILELMPKEELVGLVQQAMVSLVPLKGIPVLSTSSPNKFFESLAAGVPVIQNTQGWMKQFLEEHKIGFTISGEDPESLAKLLIYLTEHPQVVNGMRKRSKEVAHKFFDKDILSQKMLDHMMSLYE